MKSLLVLVICLGSGSSAFADPRDAGLDWVRAYAEAVQQRAAAKQGEVTAAQGRVDQVLERKRVLDQEAATNAAALQARSKTLGEKVVVVERLERALEEFGAEEHWSPEVIQRVKSYYRDPRGTAPPEIEAGDSHFQNVAIQLLQAHNDVEVLTAEVATLGQQSTAKRTELSELETAISDKATELTQAQSAFRADGKLSAALQLEVAQNFLAQKHAALEAEKVYFTDFRSLKSRVESLDTNIDTLRMVALERIQTTLAGRAIDAQVRKALSQLCGIRKRSHDTTEACQKPDVKELNDMIDGLLRERVRAPQQAQSADDRGKTTPEAPAPRPRSGRAAVPGAEEVR